MKKSPYHLLSSFYSPKKRVVYFAIYHLLPTIVICPTIGFLSRKYLSTGGFVNTRFLFFIFLVLSAASIGSIVSGLLKSKELTFLKKVGFTNKSLLLFLLYKSYRFYLPFLGLYTCLFFMEGYSVRIDSICICYVGSTLLFVAIMSITLLYNRFLCRAVIAAKYISIIILSGLVVLEFLGEINNGIGISIMKREYALSSLNIVSFVSNNLIRFSAVQLLVTVAVSGLFFKFAYGKVFYRTRDRYAISFGKTRVFSKRYGTRNPVVVFFIRDITCLFRDTSFAMLQLVYIVAAFVLFYMPAHSYNGLHLLVFVGAIFTNSFFIQALYKIDAAFISAYRKIPMTFSQFLVARICNAALISLLIPVLLLTCSFMLGRTSLRLYAIFSLILIVSSLILCAYWSSVILPFFPNINKFDIPLMVGFVVLIAAIPLLLIPKLSVIYFLIITIIIGVGVKRGSKIWRKVIREC